MNSQQINLVISSLLVGMVPAYAAYCIMVDVDPNYFKFGMCFGIVLSIKVWCDVVSERRHSKL